MVEERARSESPVIKKMADRDLDHGPRELSRHLAPTSARACLCWHTHSIMIERRRKPVSGRLTHPVWTYAGLLKSCDSLPVHLSVFSCLLSYVTDNHAGVYHVYIFKIENHYTDMSHGRCHLDKHPHQINPPSLVLCERGGVC